MSGTLVVWRHPRAAGAVGRCIGRTDLPVPRRQAKRLARRIQQVARRRRLPKIVVTSSLRRSADVGRWLARWGWRHVVDPALSELDFGDWDGRPWSAIPVAELDAWCRDFLHYRPGNGESVAELMTRMAAWSAHGARVAVGHGGWLSAARWRLEHGPAEPDCRHWPAAPRHGSSLLLPTPPA
ncbi:fructose-2,6-bisphosphatase [Ramlibacter sp. RBP-2]|uniref:Fructose-2,6-bisphosphatase n=1 Tax=Ramlibacter lithotrophicus TaxID=2606681 RepID=A0A7X6DFR6_9BURK|nr:fructose-2,6-bisphosphatase [Ramlibacter lithotrophicus]